jgi:hypothetical protein
MYYYYYYYYLELKRIVHSFRNVYILHLQVRPKKTPQAITMQKVRLDLNS